MLQQEPGLGEETIGHDEADMIQSIVTMNLATLERHASPTPRAQHPKAHGTVEAEFAVREDLPADLCHGIFQPGARYRALIRFSNSLQQNDRRADAHGMAIKLLDVPGHKLQPGQPNGTTFDIVLIDHPVFFSGSLEDYLVLNKRVGAVLDALRNEENILFAGAKILMNGLTFLIQAPKTVLRVIRFSSQKPSSVLASNYWSTTPYRFARNGAVKYMAWTERADQPGARDGVRNRNGLGEQLRSDLIWNDITFTFGVHLQTDPKAQPVEDSTAAWWPEADPSGARSMQPIATITLSGLAADSDRLSQTLVFSPWNVTQEHRPLGIMNRVRRAVYVAMADERQARSGLYPSGSTDPVEKPV